MQYRRADITGGTYFFTVNLAERKKTLLIDEIFLLREAMNAVKRKHPFQLDAMVIMPNHLHAIWTLPPSDNDYATRWMLIKANFSRGLLKAERISDSRKAKGERGIWQRRYWEHLIRDERDFKQHVDYIHYNPVKHGYVKQAAEWEYTTIHQYIAKGLINRSWGCTEDIEGSYGER